MMYGLREGWICVFLFFITAISCQTANPEQRYSGLLMPYLEAWNTGNVQLLDKIVSEKFELRMTPDYKPATGLDSLKKEILFWRTAYPDFHITVNELIFSEMAVTVRWTITATNTGPGSHPPTGRQIDVPGMSLLHIQNGKIMDEWIASNNILWMQQLGFKLLPPDFFQKE